MSDEIVFLDTNVLVYLFDEGQEPGVRSRLVASTRTEQTNRERYPLPAADRDPALSPATYCRPVAGLVNLAGIPPRTEGPGA
jgi:hypothetical protein